MRWFSHIAILLYLTILCAPQAMVVHDVRLSPLADSQIQALPPTALLQAVSQTAEADDEPPALLLSAIFNRCYFVQPLPFAAALPYISAVNPLTHPARAPPIFLLP